MAQTWVENIYTQGTGADTTLSNMELMLETLRSSFAGNSSPSSSISGQLWFDTTNNVMRYRNAAQNGFPGLMSGDSNQKIWIYRNDSLEAWTIDTSVTDAVLSLIGGSNAYSTTGGSEAGTWTQPTHTHTQNQHRHPIGNHTHQMFHESPTVASSSYRVILESITSINQFNTGRSYSDFVLNCWKSDGATQQQMFKEIQPDSTSPLLNTTYQGNYYVKNPAGTNYTGYTIDEDVNGNGTTSTWRPAAACGTLQYLDVTVS